MPNDDKKPLGPAAMAARSKGRVDTYGTRNGASVANTNTAGLVIMNPNKDPSVKGPSKHIQKMVETSQVNDKFRNLLKVRIADKEKQKAEIEFGSKPEEFLTSAYMKKREESIKLGQELEAQESASSKRDVTNMFRQMLGSGQYTRSNYTPVADQKDLNIAASSAREINRERPLDKADVSRDMVTKVLSKVVPESAENVAKAIERRVHMDTFRIMEQIDKVESVDRTEAIKIAKERYLERKRQKLQNE